jgi:Pentapeptide repeats (8 copies)
LNDDGVSLDRIDLTNASLRGLDLRGVDFSDAILVNVDLSNANFGCKYSIINILTVFYQRCSRFRGVVFDHELNDVNFRGAYLSDIRIGYPIETADFSYALMKNIKATYPSFLSGNNFSNSKIFNSKFGGIEFDRNTFSGSVLYNVDLSDTKVTEHDLLNTRSCQVTLSYGRQFGQQCADVQRIVNGTTDSSFHSFLDRIP